ncbi:MAG: enediyne biosynthesis protein UnbU [Planctomycetota bacterium]|nr:enediyne biosynthesis protein UnbU [Planctomycetota bacterium]
MIQASNTIQASSNPTVSRSNPSVSLNPTVSLYPNRNAHLRLFALWYFAILMIAWNIAGHTFLGFEQSWAMPFVAVLSACLAQIVLEWVDARSLGRKPRFSGSWLSFVNFLPPAMISGFACAMLLFPNERLGPIIFASVLSIASKVLFRIRLSNGAVTHFLNPSNFGIVVTLLLFSDVGQAPPYQFTENITGFWHWALPAAILASGIVVHGFATGRLTLCIAWLLGFVVQGVFRAWLAGNPWYVPLMPMSSAGFILFTLYMIPDPATTPIVKGRQIAFGVSVAIVYAALQLFHIVFGLFLALIAVCAVRGLCITIASAMSKAKTKSQPITRVSIPTTRPAFPVVENIAVLEEVRA